jgi:hypothetical protein
MSTDSLLHIWEAASSQPYQPVVSKDAQFTVASVLLLIGNSFEQFLYFALLT